MTGQTLEGRAWRIPRDPYARPSAQQADALRLDANEGCVTDVSLVASAGTDQASAARTYPDASGVTSALATRFGVASNRVVVTAGADDALDRICRSFLEAGRSAVVPTPTFEMLHRFVAIAGGEAITVPWRGAFPVDEVLSAVRPDTALITVVSPNNPTGAVIGQADFSRLASAAPHIPVLLDHAYVEYADEDLTDTALTYPNVIVVRTLSKAWGLAGCRVGYALTSPALATIVRNAGNPYPVSGLSLTVAERHLSEGQQRLGEHVDTVRTQRARIRRRFLDANVPVSPSQGNFVFPDFGSRAAFVQGALQSVGIVTRRFTNRADITGHVRISMPGSDTGLERLLGALDLVLDPEALLFDLDGVIANVRGSYRECVIRVAAGYGVAIDDTDIDAVKRGGHANNDWRVTQRILAARGVDVPLGEVTDRYQALYLGQDDTPGLREQEKLIPSRDTLTDIVGNRKLGIVTGRPREEAEWFLRRTGISDLIDALVCLEHGPIKPDPFPVRRALELLRCTRTWMIGDTPDDVRAAAAAGVIPIGIVAPGEDNDLMSDALLAAGAASVIPDLQTLREWAP